MQENVILHQGVSKPLKVLYIIWKLNYSAFWNYMVLSYTLNIYKNINQKTGGT